MLSIISDPSRSQDHCAELIDSLKPCQVGLVLLVLLNYPANLIFVLSSHNSVKFENTAHVPNQKCAIML